jgi:hypothetical protein
VETCDRCLHFLDRSRIPDFVDQEGGEVRLGSRKIADELQQADDFGDAERPAFVLCIAFEALADVVDIGTPFVGQIAFDQFEDFIERHERAD